MDKAFSDRQMLTVFGALIAAVTLAVVLVTHFKHDPELNTHPVSAVLDYSRLADIANSTANK